MSNQKQLFLLTLLLLSATQVMGDTVECTTILTLADCKANSANCNWYYDNTRNTCNQSVKCSANQDQASCQAQAECDWTGFDEGCRLDTSVCLINTSNYSCNTGAGCKQGTSTTCQNVLDSKWGCELLTADSCVTKNTPYCKQQYDCTYNDTVCPPTVQPGQADQSCAGACTLGAFTCSDNCAAQQDITTCQGTTGCTWNTTKCENTNQCPTSPKRVSSCTAVGCKVDNASITCNAPADYAAYCKSNNSCADATYCKKTNVTCLNDLTFCSQDGGAKNCGNPAPYKQCLQVSSKTCVNESTADTCSANTTQATCNNLCTWSNGKTCTNKTTQSQCSAQYKNEALCNTLSTTGCRFQTGGVCVSNTASYQASSQIFTYTLSLIALLLSLI